MDVAGCCWHGGMEVVSQVESQLPVKPDCGLEGEVVDAMDEDDIHPVMGDGDVKSAWFQAWGVVASVCEWVGVSSGCAWGPGPRH